MNLAWLAAVLQPRDVGPHANFPRPSHDSTGSARLAAAVIGDSALRPQAALDASDSVTMALQAFDPETIASAVLQLSRMLSHSPPDDVAEAAALALVTCTAAAELDDYETCEAVLDGQLARTPRATSADEALLRAALLQQRALRRRDSGAPYISTVAEVAEALHRFEPSQCTDFLTGPAVTWSSTVTVRQMWESLEDAAASLIPSTDTRFRQEHGLPSIYDRVRAPISNHRARADAGRSWTYSKFIADLFRTKFGAAPRYLFGPANKPDLFHVLLQLELLGHNDVYSVRKELALLRLVQEPEAGATGDSVRLLRHAAARDELGTALQHLRLSGPLDALSQDARQILRRTNPHLLRTVELEVLRVAADLLAPAEAQLGVEAVRASLEAGGPPDLPGSWQLPVLRREAAWKAVAALGRAGGVCSEVAALLHQEVVSETNDAELLDLGMRRAVAELDWSQVSAQQREIWLESLAHRSKELPATASFVHDALGVMEATTADEDVSGIARQLNSLMRGVREDLSFVPGAIPVIEAALRQKQENAGRGMYTMASTNVADVAAGLVIHADAHVLWPLLSDFLIDSRVPALERTAAFDRLAHAEAGPPPEVAAQFRAVGAELILRAPFDLEEPVLVPYPAALRFLGAHMLVDPGVVYDAIAKLAGSREMQARREAAVTIAVLAPKMDAGYLAAVALPLSNDESVEVRAHAGRALTALARSDTPVRIVSLRRVQELLREDGLVAPLLVLRALAESSRDVPTAIREEVARLAIAHPSRSIRQEAERLLRRGWETTGPDADASL